MRVVLWIGNEANQKALANRINQEFPISGIVTETKLSKRKISLRKIFEKLYEKVFLSTIDKAWWGMKAKYEHSFPTFPPVKILDVENINSESAFQFTQELAPDLIIVSGTRMIKEKMLSMSPSIGILNLHTGLSPYIKGGPNCTNWCIATKQYHMIGNTVMWIDKGIDTGNILATEFTPLLGDERFGEIHTKVMDHAHDLYVRAIRFLSAGGNRSIKQSDISKGVTYYTKQWGLKEKAALLRNYKNMSSQLRLDRLESSRIGVKVYPLDKSTI